MDTYLENEIEEFNKAAILKANKGFMINILGVEFFKMIKKYSVIDRYRGEVIIAKSCPVYSGTDKHVSGKSIIHGRYNKHKNRVSSKKLG